nr:alpha-D-ribose 1-methylphosphonate 5-triphosphate diphosphatase [Escherichia coli]
MRRKRLIWPTNALPVGRIRRISVASDTRTTRRKMINVQNVSKTFILHQQNGVRLPVLQRASLTVNAGECVVLHGHSGSGKSTLLRSLYANYLPDEGQIQIKHGDEWVDLVTAPARKVVEIRKTTVGWVSQFLRVIPRISALEVVMQPLLDTGVPREACAAKAARLLTRLNVPERLWHLAPSTFSGGEQQRVNIARGFIVDYPILLLDEPTASLDAKNSAAVVELIREAKARGAAIVGIFHDEAVRNDVADRLPEAMDGEGGWLLPGLIELHTDNLDKFFTPRPKVDWPAHSAMSSHDALMVASGITTVLDAVAIGDVRDGGDRLENLEKMINAIEETQKRGVNRAEHRLHLRCELPHHTTLPLFEKLVQREPVTLVSLMDHSPGQRQFANREKYREYYQGKYSLTDAQMQQYEEEQLALAARWSQPNRETIAALCRARQIALASHDDATHAHVAESHQLGSVIAEFPTTFEAAEASRRHGMNVLMGAPNIVRGGSHSGNVAASELAQLGLLDILSSDYYPASLLDAAFRVADDQSNRFTLPQAVKLVTKNPAQALNLQDRGVIGEGKRADLVLAHRKGNHIHIDHVWRQGKRVF